MSPEDRMLRQIVAQLGIPDAFVAQLVEAEIVELRGDLIQDHVVERIRVSWCLHDELGVNLAGVEVALNLIDRLQDERRTLAEAMAELEATIGQRRP